MVCATRHFTELNYLSLYPFQDNSPSTLYFQRMSIIINDQISITSDASVRDKKLEGFDNRRVLGIKNRDNILVQSFL